MLAALTGGLVAIAATATTAMTTSAQQPDHAAHGSERHGAHSVDEAALHHELAQVRCGHGPFP